MHPSLDPQHPSPSETATPAEQLVPAVRNRAGLAALILGIVAMVLAVIPFVNLAVGAVGLAGIVVGIVALTRTGQPKGQGLTGLILSVVASILAAVLAVVYSLTFLGSALDGLEDAGWEIEWEVSGGDAGDEGEEIPWTNLNPEPVEDAGIIDGPGFAEGEATATSPAKLGTPMRTIGMRDWEYQLVLGPAMLDADALVVQLDAGNPPPKEGTRYIAVQATVTYLGSGEAIPHFNVEFVYPDGERTALKDVYRKIEGANTQFKGLELATGESYTETFVRQARVGDLSDGMWVVVQPFWRVDYFFEAQ